MAGDRGSAGTDAADPVEREIAIDAPPESVWPYWVDPALLVRWMGSAAVVDPVPGGAFRVEYANGAVMRGAIVEVEPPRRLVLTWGWEDPDEAVRPGGSRVEVTFEPIGRTATRVRVRHLGLPADERDGHGEGWDYFLDRLRDALS